MKEETKTLIVTETLRYEFAVPASLPEDEDALKCYFGSHPDPWGGADFAAVTDRDFEIQNADHDLVVLASGEPESPDQACGIAFELLRSLKDLEIILSGKPYDRDEQALLREAREVIIKGNSHLLHGESRGSIPDPQTARQRKAR